MIQKIHGLFFILFFVFDRIPLKSFFLFKIFLFFLNLHQGTVLCQVFYNLAKVVKPDREPSPGAFFRLFVSEGIDRVHFGSFHSGVETKEEANDYSKTKSQQNRDRSNYQRPLSSLRNSIST